MVACGAAAAATALVATAGGNAPSSQVVRGAQLYAQHCVLCHGADGRGGQGFPRPIWGEGHDLAKFGNAQGLFEYLQLLMPFDDPTKIGDDDKVAITAYLLRNNGDLAADQALEAERLAALSIR